MRYDVERRRKRKFWSRDRLAREANVHSNTLLALEKGKTFPRPETMERIAQALGCTVDDLIIEEDVPTMTNPAPQDSAERLRTAS